MKVFKKADGIMTLSEIEAASIKRQGFCDKTMAIHSPIDSSVYKPLARPQKEEVKGKN